MKVVYQMIVDVEEKRTVTLKDNSTKELQSLILADDTASIKITLWGEQTSDEFEKGDVIEVVGIYSKFNSYSNQMEANLSRKGQINKINKSISPVSVQPSKSSNPPQNKDMSDFSSRVKIDDVDSKDIYVIKGAVIKEINRIFVYQACSNCGRKPDNCKCQESHEESNRMVLNSIVDDGSSTIRATFFGDLAERFLGESADTVHELQLNNELDNMLKIKNKQLLGNEYLFKGRGKYSDFTNSYELNVMDFRPINPIEETN